MADRLTVCGIDHIVLRSTRIAEMAAFYGDVLGCEVERQTTVETGLMQLRAGHALIDLVAVDSELGRLGGGAPTEGDNNLDHFCLQIEPMSESEIVGELKKKGVQVGEFTKRYGSQGFGRSIYINDPDGNTVELRCRK